MATTTTLEALRRQAATCTACDLYKHATQTVFGEGPVRAGIVLIGEQPGHEEDLAGHPFVGPAGRLLDQALERADLDRHDVYITNAVKHFKWTKDKAGGKRRIHDKPNQSEVEACHPWLDQELWLIQPDTLVCLGATAAQAIFRRRMTISASRGQRLTSPMGIPTFVTVHPSAILRIRERASREAELDRFVDDLRRAARSV